MRRTETTTVQAKELLSIERQGLLVTCHQVDWQGSRSLFWFASQIGPDLRPLMAINLGVALDSDFEVVDRGLLQAVFDLASFSRKSMHQQDRTEAPSFEMKMYPQELAELVLARHVTMFLEFRYGCPKSEFASVKPMVRYEAVDPVYAFLANCGQPNPMQILIVATGRSRALVNKDVWQSRVLRQAIDSNRGEK